MNRWINVCGINSNEIYTISCPNNLINFIKYDFTVFMERCIDLCRLYSRTGEYKSDDVITLRNSITGCHRYYEQNVRGIFDKIVVDCWIEYMCRQNEIGIVTLWNNMLPCRNDFEKTIFRRVSEYRHGKAINQWVNLLKIQEYAQRKVDFVFGRKLSDKSDYSAKTEAAAKANYFDLMYNVAANELGFDVRDIGVNKVYSVGRIPNSPFIMSNVSKEIVRNVLSDMKFSDEVKFRGQPNEQLSDQIAMDAFSSIKTYIPAETDNLIDTIIKAMTDAPQKVYMPTCFKGVVDLEIDSLIESGAIIQRCARCREYFVKDAEYNFDYCDRVDREGRTCLEIMTEKDLAKKKAALLTDTTLLNMRCDQLYKEMSARVNVEITQRDFSDWFQYMQLIRENVSSGKATMEDFDSFVDYSRSMNFTPPQREPEPAAKVEVKTAEEERIKPFAFPRLDRSAVSQDISRPDYSETPPGRAEPISARSGGYRQPEPKPVFAQQHQYKPAAQVPQSPPTAVPVAAAIPPVSISPSVAAPTGTVLPPPGGVSRIIRGGVNAVPYEQSFEEAPRVVSIPNGEKSAGKPDTVLNSMPVSESDEDVKIYNVKGEPLKPEEFVKVYDPTKKTRKHRQQEQKLLEKPEIRHSSIWKDDTVTATQDAVAVKHVKDAPSAETPIVKPEAKPEPAIKLPDNPKKAKAFSAYINLNAPAQEPEPIREPLKVPSFEDIKQSVDEENTGKQRETHEEAGFSDILKGIERKDTFASEEDETNVSHKTKHVIDAIFKPSKASPLLNLGGEDDKR